MDLDPNRPVQWPDGAWSIPAASAACPGDSGERVHQVLDLDEPGLTQPMQWTIATQGLKGSVSDQTQAAVVDGVPRTGSFGKGNCSP